MTLAAENLGFGYRGRRVGSGVSLDLRAGEVLCLLGPNGGGKTTLLKTMLGLVPALDGTIRLDGEDLTSWSRKRLARVVGYVPQAHAAFFPFTVLDVVMMGRSAHIGLFSAPSRSDREIARRALGTLGISHLEERIYTEISGGERQLVLIARALAATSCASWARSPRSRGRAWPCCSRRMIPTTSFSAATAWRSSMMAAWTRSARPSRSSPRTR
jgi:iron complex transport system ATP-binding protein